MKLKSLKIIFESTHQFLKDSKKSIESITSQKKSKLQHSISFDNMESFKKVMTANRLELIIAIGRLRPSSINQLSKLLNREFPHVFKDCKLLEAMGFIKLEQAVGLRRQFTPMLSFEYDLIRVKSPLEEIFPISNRSNKILLEAV